MGANAVIYNLGSINIDHFYRVGHLPAPGETLAAEHYGVGLGGKGANQSVAAARAGARVCHLGGAGQEDWALDRLQAFGVDGSRVQRLDVATGHAIIMVDQQGENAIVLFPGANRAFDPDPVLTLLAQAAPGDTLMLQNETAHQATAARMARDRGMRVIYSAAPFEAEAVRAVLPFVTILALNTVEASQLCAAMGCGLEDLPVPQLLLTHGAKGAEWRDLATGTRVFQPAFAVAPVDTTGAGDTFAGYFAAALDEGLAPQAALRMAAAAAAIMVTRAGTAEAIPTRSEVLAFLAAQPSE